MCQCSHGAHEQVLASRVCSKRKRKNNFLLFTFNKLKKGKVLNDPFFDGKCIPQVVIAFKFEENTVGVKFRNESGCIDFLSV